MSKTLVDVLRKNYENLLERVERACLRAGRSLEEVKILGASKGQSEEKIRVLYSLGLKLFGENYVQEAEKKIKNLADLDIDWHFIGRLQTNKAKKAVALFSTIHSLDRLSLAEELEKRARSLNKRINVLIEVNIGHEATKAGVFEENLEEFVKELKGFPNLNLIGLMCLPPLTDDKRKTRFYFQKMRNLFERIKPLVGEGFTQLSTGTSSDFEIAIEEGATIIRIGTLLFGPRM